MFEPIRTALSAEELHIGLIRGLFAAAAVAVVARTFVVSRLLLVMWGRRSARVRSVIEARNLLRPPRRLPGLAGIAFVAAALPALAAMHATLPPQVADDIPTVPSVVVLGLILLWAGVALAGRTATPVPFGIVLAVPGAVLLVWDQQLPGPGWLRWVIVLGTVIGGPLAAETDRRLGRAGIGCVMWLFVVGACYSTVPDTELALVLLGVAIPLAVLGPPVRLARLGDGGVAAAIGLLLWVSVQEGWYRPSSVIGTLGALALFTTMPIGLRVRRWVAPRVRWDRKRRAFAIIVVQLLLALWAARVAGTAPGTLAALVLLVPAVAAGIAFGALLPTGRRRSPRQWGRSEHRSRRRSGSRPHRAPARPEAAEEGSVLEAGIEEIDLLDLED